ncbi:MAG: hypothetical protein ABI587_11325, partial [Gemmatimonadales bacterium]
MRTTLLTAGFCFLAGSLAGQQPASVDTTAMTAVQRASFRVEQVKLSVDTLTLRVGDTIPLQAVALDAAGQPVPAARILFIVPGRQAVLVGSDHLTGTKPGRGDIRAFVLRPATPGDRARMIASSAVLVVQDLPVIRIEIEPAPGTLYAGTTLGYGARAFVEEGRESEDAELGWATGRAGVATVDRYGHVTAVAPGTTTLTARAGAITATEQLTVLANPIAQLRISGGAEKARTGDVVHFAVSPLNAAGRPVTGVVPVWSVSGQQLNDDVGARVWPDGGFVADAPGLYTVLATVGQRSARVTIRVDPRNSGRGVKLIGRGLQTDHSTSELHVWTGGDGRDYAYVGTHAAGVRPNVTGNVVLVYDVT